MRPVERAGFLAHARTPAFARRLAEADACIDAMLARCARPFVSYSCGKDSTALLWLVAQHRPTIAARVLTGGETRLLYPEIDDHLAWWRAACPAMDLREIHIDHVFAPGWEDATWAEQHASFEGEWDRFLWGAGEGWDGVFLGLRGDESRQRRLALWLRLPGQPHPIMRYGSSYMPNAAGCLRACPLARWTEHDIGALHALHDLPLLDTYRRDGLGARTKLRTGRTAIRLGQIAELRRRDPAAYNRLIARFPELSRHA